MNSKRFLLAALAASMFTTGCGAQLAPTANANTRTAPMAAKSADAVDSLIDAYGAIRGYEPGAIAQRQHVIDALGRTKSAQAATFLLVVDDGLETVPAAAATVLEGSLVASLERLVAEGDGSSMVSADKFNIWEEVRKKLRKKKRRKSGGGGGGAPPAEPIL